MKIISALLAVCLLLCLAPMPYDYFTFIRFATMVVAAIWAAVFYNEKKTELAVASGAVALLFQPFVKIALGRTMWNVVDVAVAIALIAITVCYDKTNSK